MSDSRASVIVLAWNGIHFLPACLNSVFSQEHPDFEVIVVDNGSTDGSADYVTQHYPQARLIRNAFNRGFAAGNNAGLRMAAGDILVLLNQDTVVSPDWLAPIREALREQKRAGIVGCRLLYPDGRVQHAGGRLIEPSWDSEHLSGEEPNARIDYVTAAACAIRRDCFEAVGEFDEGFYPAYSEDVDYCLRAQALGWQVVYEPRSIVTHYESQSRGDTVDFLVNINAQRLRLVMKHRDVNWIRHTFTPFECERIARNQSLEWLLAIAHSYLRAAGAARQVLEWQDAFYGRRPQPGALDALLDALFRMRCAAVARLADLTLVNGN